MSKWIDPKGKHFTHVVSKDEVAVTIQTIGGLLHGHVFLSPEQRLKDAMNGDEQFIPVAHAHWLDGDGHLLAESGLVLLNRDHIVWIAPEESASDDESPDDTAAID